MTDRSRASGSHRSRAALDWRDYVAASSRLAAFSSSSRVRTVAPTDRTLQFGQNGASLCMNKFASR